VTRLQRPGLVLIDLDGTLIDSLPDIREAANRMLADLDQAPLSSRRISEFVGNGIDRMVHRCLTRDLEGEAGAEAFSRARKLFLKHYAFHNGRHSRLYPGVLEGLEKLRDASIKLACVTNKAAAFSDQLLRHFGICGRFAALVAGDTLTVQKPHPRPLLHTAQLLGVGVLQTLMVGDSVHDVAAARAAGMPVVAVSYGYNHGQAISAAGPDAIIDRLDQLVDLFAPRV